MPAVKEKLQNVKLDINPSNREGLVDLLSTTLADTFDLSSQIKQAHWNVRGIGFWEFHKMFDAVHAAIEPFVDEVAERIGTLGGVAQGTVRVAAANSNLKEFDLSFGDGKTFTTLLRDRVADYVKVVRAGIDKAEDLGDPTTADLLTEISRVADQQLYFLESHLH